MAMTPSWESLNGTIQDLSSRIRDLETARRVFTTRSLTIPNSLIFGDGGTFPLNVWQSTGPSISIGPDIVSVPVYSGSMLVVATAEISVGGGVNPADFYMSWSVDGPTPVPESENRALHVAWEPQFSDFTKIAASYAFMHTGLAAGNYSIYSKYRCNSVGTSPLSGATVKNRHILAVPF